MKGLILEIVDSISLLLVFNSLFFTMKYDKINMALHEKKPIKEKKTELKKYNEKIKRTIYIDCLPVFIMSLLTVFILTPTVLEICFQTKINFLSFDPVITLFIFVYFWIVIILIYSAAYVVRLKSKLKR